MKRIRGGRGLGDSIYLRPIAEHFLRQGEEVTMLTDYPGVFHGIPVFTEPFSRFRVDVLAHYVLGKTNPTTNQWDDVCASAGVQVPLRFDWKVENQNLVDRLRENAAGRPIVVVHGGRVPMGRKDGFGAELLPEQRAFDVAINALSDPYLVRVGNSESLYPLACYVDLTGKLSITDLLDVAYSCDAVIGQCSFAIPMAEVFDKPLLIVWASQGLISREPYVRQITPQKVLSKPSSRFVMDDWTPEKIEREAQRWWTDAARAGCWPEEELKTRCAS